MSACILGISAFYHDSAACLVREGQIVAAAQEERFSRIKHDAAFPDQAVAYCLREAGITIADVTHVAFYDKPWIKFERLLETYLTVAPRGYRTFMKAMPLWLNEKLWMGDEIRRRIEFDGPLYFPEHHQSHAASAFFPSPFLRAAILTIDGVGEWATATMGVGAEGRIDLSHELRFPHSLGLLYSAFTYYLGFTVNSGEYKLMGLAPYGEPRYADLIRDRLMDLREDGSFRLDMDYFDYCGGLTMTSSAFHDLFGGPPRVLDSRLAQRHFDLARSIQIITEEIVLRMARHLKQVTGESRLCLAGGVALNCVANGKLLRSGLFEDIWVQPAAGDAGGALGAALLIAQHVSPDPGSLQVAQKGSLLGPSWSDEDIEKALLHTGGLPVRAMDREDLFEYAAECLEAGSVLGWFQGRMEFGPRALGCRSILADPRNPDAQRVINQKIKFRENFRPFAPAVLAERVHELFDMDVPSPYMTLVAPVLNATILGEGLDRLRHIESPVPAVTHVDGTARIQTVGPEADPDFRRLLETFATRTGCPVLVNTSFNIRGEPIVCTPRDAIACFLKTDLDVLVIGPFVVEKKDLQPENFHASRPPEAPATYPRKPADLRNLRKFGWTMSAAFGVVAAYFFWRDSGAAPYAAIVAGLFLVATHVRPAILSPVERVWMAIAHVLGAVMTRIMLTLAFFLVLTPFGWLLKAIGKDLLDRSFNENCLSYWTPIEPDGPHTRLNKPY